MPRKKYKTYLEPDSTHDIPRTSVHNKRKRESIEPNHMDDIQPINVVNPAPSNAWHHSQSIEHSQAYSSQNDIHEREISEERTSNAMNEDNDIGTERNTSKEDTNESLEEEEEGDEEWFDVQCNDFDISPVSSDDEDVPTIPHNENTIDHEDHDEIFQADRNKEKFDRYLSQPVCQCTVTTIGEALIMALLVGLKNSMSWVGILDIINMVNKLFNNDVLPSTKYKLFKYFPLQEGSFKYNIFCSTCEKYIGERQNIQSGILEVCDSCGNQFDETKLSSFFITLNFRSQLETVLKYPEVANNLNYRFSRQKKNDQASEDIYDGDMYRKYASPGNPLNNPLNLSYTFNTDGCQAANSSNVSIWPIYAMVHQLPPKMRARHMFLIGLWVHKKEPNMNTFLQPFVDEANSLANEGVQWALNGRVVTSKVYPICCCVDSVARPCMLNMIRFNGSYGCNFCEHPTEGVDRYRKYTITTYVPPDRTDDSIRSAMIRSLNGDITVIENKGVKGPSVLMNLEGFDLSGGMVPDYMHSVLLGVSRQYTELILSSPEAEYYVGAPNQLAIINQRLLSIHPPTCITRSPRTLQERRNWKASEWRSWLVWYILICLRGVLPAKYLKHLALLVTAVQMLLEESITRDMIDRAEVLLIKFVTGFQVHFGKAAMTFNVHLLLHLSTSVRNWGPLWTHNAFCFENENRHVLQMKTSPYLIAVQIARRFLFYKQLPTHYLEFSLSDRFVEFCDNHFQNRLKFFNKSGDCTLIGSGKDYNLNLEEEVCFGSQLACKSFVKMLYHGLRFTSDAYNRANKSNDSLIVTRDGSKGIITNICSYNSDENAQTQKKVTIFFRQLRISERPYIETSNVSVRHIRECFIDNNALLRMCDPASLIGHCLLMHVNERYYVSEIPLGCFGD